MRFFNIQVARAIAANAVLLFHLHAVELKYSQGFAILGKNSLWGIIGVDLFFVISGFIMAVTSCNASPLKFIYSRVTRIYPVYWFYSLIVLAVFLIAPQMVNSSSDVKPVLWKSFLLFPDYPTPLLAVGWTLIHEIYFYIVFSLILFSGSINKIKILTWGIIIAVIRNYALLDSPFLNIMTHPLTIEFICGVFVGLCVKNGAKEFSSLSLILGVVGLVVAFCYFDPEYFSDIDSWVRVLVLSAVFSSIIYGITTCHQKEKHGLVYKLLLNVGDASYSLYLSHVLVISAFGRVFYMLPFHNYIFEIIFVISSVISANIIGVLSYKYLERPVLTFFKKFNKSYKFRSEKAFLNEV